MNRFDFGLKNFSYLVVFTVFCISTLVFLSPFTVSVDGFSYLKSAEVLFTEEFSSFYTWVREPGYPLFIWLFEGIGGLLLVFLVQGLMISFGILSTQYATYRLLNFEIISWRSFAAAGLATLLLSGYASTILQQAALILIFGLLMLVISRIVLTRKLDVITLLLVFLLITTASIIAVFIGLAFGLALFATLLAARVFKPKVLLTYSMVSISAFALVMIPWTQIKSNQAPKDSLDAVSMAVFSTNKTLTNFSLEKEFYEAILTQAALLNLGGEFPPISGLGIANENRIFGSPVYTSDQACGRFLTGVEPDTLWGKIETSYRDRCVPQRTLALISQANHFAQLFYPLVGLALLTTLILSIRYRAHLRPIILPAFLITLPYIVMDSSISRYGALVIPLGALLLFEFIQPKALLDRKGDGTNSSG
jgi:hypothetical protein